MGDYDWDQVAARLRVTDWYLLGKDLPYTVAKAIMQNRITAMRGVLVKTRKNRFDSKGKRWCDVYLRLPGTGEK